MTVRAESLAFPTTLFRRLLTPALPWTLLVAFAVVLTERLLRPRLPRMSAEWLQDLERQTNIDE